MASVSFPRGVVVRGPMKAQYDEILTPEALKFVANLHRRFDERRLGLLKLRERRQQELDAGAVPTFPKHTEWIRKGHWKGPSIPPDLMDRRVEITGPPDRKMVINALNSGAKVFMADFEDSSCPTWDSVVFGQINMRDAVNKTISFTNPNGKTYKLKKNIATLMVRPRGWHLQEAHILVDGRETSGSLVDFGLYFFHNAANLMARGSGPYFYLPKMESHLEARLWNDVFLYAQEYCNIPRGSIRATVLCETILAAFELDEILFELREHSAGMNCGRWDYIFSFIKVFRSRPDMVLPDRANVGMNKPFMQAYVNLVVQTCHKRGVHAMGGMAAQIPIKNDEAANKKAFDKVRADKLREVKAGHDGTWVAHPGLMQVALDEFDAHMKTPHQIHVLRQDVKVTEADLLDVGRSEGITEAGLRANLSVGLRYLEAWLRGVGCVPIHNLMEDAATAEISRSQVWQWLKHGATIQLASGATQTITRSYVERVLAEELRKIKSDPASSSPGGSKWDAAVRHYANLMFSDELADFLTLKCYPEVTTITAPTIGSSL